MNAPSMHAQPPQAAREFEVASVKLIKSGGAPIDTIELHFYMSNARAAPFGGFSTRLPLTYLIQLAYGVKEAQILGAPSWANSDRYEIEAKASGNATFEQMRPMLQSLLADRFKLTLNRSVKEAAVYELVVAKGGPKFEPSKAGSCIPMDPKAPPPPMGSKICGGVIRGHSRIGPEQMDRIHAYSISMPALVEVLSDEVGRTIVDTTGLKGLFDVQLEFVPANAISSSLQAAQFGVPGTTAPSASFSGPSVFSALRDQLGLQLESSKGPVEVLVIEHVEKPSPN